MSKMVRLGDVISTLESGKREAGGAINSGIPSLGAEHLSNNGDFNLQNMKYISQELYNQMKSGKIQKGDILIVKDGATTGKVSYVSDDFPYSDSAINEHVFLLRPKKELLSKYVFHFLFSDFGKKKILDDFRGSTVGGISKKFVNLTIPIPELSEQAHIVSVLDTAALLIESRKKQIALLDEAEKSLFVEMFGDPETNPKNWKIGTIRDIVSEVKYGTSKPAIEGGSYMYLRMNNITYSGRLDLTDVKYIDISENELEKYLVKKGDILFNRTNSKELVGKTCVFNEEKPVIIAGYIIRVRPNNFSNSEFISGYLNSKYSKKTLANMCKKIVGQANINAQELQDIRIYIPPLPLQQQFASRIDSIESRRRELEEGLTKMEEARAALMQKYFE